MSKETQTRSRTSITYPNELDPRIDALIELGVVDNRSDFFVQAAYEYLLFLSRTTEVNRAWLSELESDSTVFTALQLNHRISQETE